jgi:hypothetical protein
MQDWQQMLRGCFRKRNICFKLNNMLDEIKEVMKTKAKAKSIEFFMNAKFDDSKRKKRAYSENSNIF